MIINSYINKSIISLKYVLVGRLLSAFSSNFLIFAIPLLVYKFTQDSGWSGYTYFLEWSMRLISLVFASYIIAGLGIWRSLFISDIVRVFACLITGILLIYSNSLTALILLSMLNGLLFDISFISIENICQRVAKKEDISYLQAIIQLIDQIALIGAPLIAAGLIFLWSPVSIILLAAVGYGISFLLVYIQHLQIKVPVVVQKMHRLIFTALENIFSRPNLVRLILETNAINLLFGSILVLNPAIITGFFNKSDTFFAIANVFLGGIGIVCVLLAPEGFKRVGQNFGIGCVVLAIMSAYIVGLAPLHIYGYVILAGLIIGFDSAFAVYLRVERARSVDPDTFQKIIPFMMLFNAIAFPISGILVSLFSNYMEDKDIFIILASLSLLILILSRFKYKA